MSMTPEEIAERWKDRSWPNIGYFTHGQAVADIDTLLAAHTAALADIKVLVESLDFALGECEKYYNLIGGYKHSQIGWLHDRSKQALSTIKTKYKLEV